MNERRVTCLDGDAERLWWLRCENRLGWGVGTLTGPRRSDYLGEMQHGGSQGGWAEVNGFPGGGSV